MSVQAPKIDYNYTFSIYTGWLGGLLAERRTSVSQIRGSIPGPIVKRHWHVLRMLSGAIPSTWALAFSFSFYITFNVMVTQPSVNSSVHPESTYLASAGKE